MLGAIGTVQAQTQNPNFRQVNLPNYDNKMLHFGFYVGGHQSSFRLRYNEDFTTFDSLHSIIIDKSPGVSIGFLANFHLFQYLDVRPMFKVAFYEYDLTFNYTDPEQRPDFKPVEAAMVELPIMFRYRSMRRRNFGMYLVGGVTPSLQVGGRPDDDKDPNFVHTHNENLAVEYGFGLDIYYPLFKFSPEIRISHGLRNMIKPGINDYSAGIDRLNTHSVSLYLLVQ